MPSKSHRGPIALIALTACAVAIGGCGSSSDPATAATRGFAQAIKFSECMRAHGVPDFPDPKSAGGGIQIKLSPGMNPFSPAFKAAQTACHALMPGGGPGSGPPSAQAKAQLLKIAQCMRAHGITDFPDPTLTQPTGPGNNSLVLGRGGVFLAVPNTIDVNSPAFGRAAKACHFGGP